MGEVAPARASPGDPTAKASQPAQPSPAALVGVATTMEISKKWIHEQTGESHVFGTVRRSCADGNAAILTNARLLLASTRSLALQ